MKIQTATISTRELQQALRDYCAANGGVPDRVIIQSYEKQIVVDLLPGGMITADEFHHAAFGT
jgi:translation initiation factor 1 (eIF-1/SUI1)